MHSRYTFKRVAPQAPLGVGSFTFQKGYIDMSRQRYCNENPVTFGHTCAQCRYWQDGYWRDAPVISTFDMAWLKFTRRVPIKLGPWRTEHVLLFLLATLLLCILGSKRFSQRSPNSPALLLTVTDE